MLAIRLPEDIEARLETWRSVRVAARPSMPAKPSWNTLKTWKIFISLNRSFAALNAARSRSTPWRRWRLDLAWRIEVSETAEKQLAKLDKPVAKRLRTFLLERIATLDDPRSIGQALKGSELGEFWKYRVGDWRLICQIKDDKILITVVRLGNRREVYR
jgi:mRNA interferase RelE/StbE